MTQYCIRFNVKNETNTKMYYYNLQVTVIGKIMNIEPEEETTTRSGKKMKFVSAKLPDTSGTIKLLIWGQRTSEITLGNSYKVENVGIKEFNVKYLSTSPSTLDYTRSRHWASKGRRPGTRVNGIHSGCGTSIMRN